MKLDVCTCLWYIDIIDQFCGTLVGTNPGTDERRCSRMGNTTKTVVFLHTSDYTSLPQRTAERLPNDGEQPMNADKQHAPVTVYQLKVSLRDVSPMIWRRLLVTSDTTIAHLHAILQTAMGWGDIHLHRFRVHGKDYGIYRAGGLLFDDNPYQVRLSDFRLRASERFVYEYDMGDFWQHDIRLERVLPLDLTTTYPVCTAGAGGCPPEDCGGPWGYRTLLDEQYSLLELLQARKDVLLVAQRLLDFYDGGPRPTTDDVAFMEALERMHDRLEDAPITFNRRAVNVALRTLRKETTCTFASR